MFTIWGKVMKKGKIIADYTAYIDDYSLTRTQKVYKALADICNELNLSTPIWLELNKKDFIKFAKTRFTQDSFIDTIDFDFLEFQVIEEDY